MIPFGSPHIFLQEGLLPVKQRITCCVEELKEELPVQPIVLGILGSLQHLQRCFGHPLPPMRPTLWKFTRERLILGIVPVPSRAIIPDRHEAQKLAI